MAKVSLPLYRAFAVYSYVDMLSFLNLPCTGFCEISEPLTEPRILTGNKQLPPDAMTIEPVEFAPQSASVINAEQSEAARAKDRRVKLVTPTTRTKAATLDNRIVDFPLFLQDPP